MYRRVIKCRISLTSSHTYVFALYLLVVFLFKTFFTKTNNHTLFTPMSHNLKVESAGVYRPSNTLSNFFHEAQQTTPFFFKLLIPSHELRSFYSTQTHNLKRMFTIQAIPLA